MVEGARFQVSGFGFRVQVSGVWLMASSLCFCVLGYGKRIEKKVRTNGVWGLLFG